MAYNPTTGKYGYYVGNEFFETSVPEGYKTATAALYGVKPAATGTAGTAGAGAIPGTYNAAYGGVPSAPTAEESQTAAIQANAASLPSLQAVADQINAARWGTYTGRVPNYADLATQESSNIDYLLGGGTPTESWARSAAANLGMGVAGSQFGNTLVAQNIESDRIKKAQLGQQMLQNVWSRASSVPSYDVSAGLLTPQQTYNANLARAIYGSAAVPESQAGAAMLSALQGMRYGQSAAMSFFMFRWRERFGRREAR